MSDTYVEVDYWVEGYAEGEDEVTPVYDFPTRRIGHTPGPVDDL